MKVFSFEFYHQDELDDDELVVEAQLEPLAFAFSMIKKNLEILNRDILFLAKREEVHRDLIEQTCDRVM